MSLKLPTGYSLYGVSNDGNTVTAQRDGSTPDAPVFLKITRKAAVYQQGQKRFSVPTMEFRFTRGLKEGDPSLPIPEQELALLTVREPIGHTGTDNVVKDVIALVNQTSFYEGVIAQVLPTCCDDTP